MARHSLRLLLSQTSKPAVLVARAWQAANTVYEFEQLGTFQEVAGASGCFMIALGRPMNGGIEHLLFVATSESLANEAYFACIDDSPQSSRASPKPVRALV